MTAGPDRPGVDVADAAQPPPTGDGVGPTIDLTDATLIPAAQRPEFESRWRDIQARFVDSPRSAVDDAQALVDEALGAVSAGFAQRKAALDERGASDAETEELRQSLRGYRDFFERLLQL
jgi:hypothetical protein